jgi:hypothetical protein
MCTLAFLKDVLKGSKKLLKNNAVAGIPKIPKIPEVNAQLIWNDIKNDQLVAVYFPDAYIHGNRTPDRNFMFTVSLLRYLLLLFLRSIYAC